MQKLLAAFLSAAMLLSMAVPSFAKTDKNNLKYLDLVDSNGEIAYYDNTDTIKPGDKYYIVIGKSTGTNLDNLLDKNLFTFRLKKKNGSKYITDADIVEKRFGNTRYVCIEFSAKDNFTDEENKVTLEATFKAKQDLAASNPAGIAAGDFPIFVPVTSGAGSSSAAAAEQKYHEAEAAYTAAQKTTQEKEDAYNTAKNNKEQAATQKTAAEAEKQTIVDRYPGETVTVAWLQQKATEAGTAATNAANAAALTTSYDTLKTAWSNWATAYDTALDDSKPGADSTEFTSLANALTAYQTALKAVTVPSEVTQTTLVGIITGFTLPSDLSSLDLTTSSEPYAQLWRAVDASGTNKDNEPNYIAAVQAACGTEGDWTAKQTKYTDDANALQAAEDKIAAATANANLDLTSYQTAWDQAKAAEATALKAKNTAYDIWQGILNGTSSNVFLAKNDTYSFDFTVWIQNERQEDDDANFVAGEKGVVIRPVKNETNTITWENSNRTLARLIFEADSDTDYLCPRLSTRWNNEDYMGYFNDQDAYLFDFVSNPDIPAQTRGRLELYNPFIDSNGDYYRKARNLYLYEVVNGILKEVDFTPMENDEGEDVLMIKTRTLGTYVVCEDPLDLDKIYDNNQKPSKPSDANKPDIVIDANQKPVPNTGR